MILTLKVQDVPCADVPCADWVISCWFFALGLGGGFNRKGAKVWWRSAVGKGGWFGELK